MARLVVVSNRVPLPSERGAKAGGLAVALADALQPGSLWFGWSGRRSARGSGTTHIQRSEGITYATIDLTEADYRSFYVNFSNGALWPLLHFRLGLLEFHSEDYDGYRPVNRQFAAALLPLLRPDDMIWVHDYHLIPLAAELRALGVTNRIGFFLHTPFVPPSIFNALPRSAELLAEPVRLRRRRLPHTHLPRGLPGLRRPKISGFIADPDGRFVWRGHVGAGRSSIRSASTPMRSRNRRIDAARGSDARLLRDSLSKGGLAIGVDRLDYSKGLINRFEAIGRFFAQLPAASAAGQLPADRRPLARGTRRLSAPAARTRPYRRRHEWPVLRIRLDPAALHDPSGQARHAGGVFPAVAAGRGHAVARRHEPRRQGIRRGAGPG